MHSLNIFSNIFIKQFIKLEHHLKTDLKFKLKAINVECLWHQHIMFSPFTLTNFFNAKQIAFNLTPIVHD